MLKESPVVFHNGLNYEYHFIIKVLTKEFEGVFNCLEEDTENYKAFSVPLTQEVTKVRKYEKEITKTIS